MTASGPALRNVTGYVLAGGRSSRMGQDKALLEHDGEPLVERALRTLRAVCAHTRILSGPANFDRDALLSRYGHLVSDTAHEHGGPLAALAAALADCRTPYALLLAVDQPQASAGLLGQLVTTAMANSAIAACFQDGAQAEPLPLFASRDLRHALHQALAEGERRLLPGVQSCARALGQKVLLLDLADGEKAQITNLNTPSDLQQWKRSVLSNQSALNASERSDG
ncbi:molybdenum cofactor guanylyltransferase [Terriglobus sp.]|uniref:molybdenum cofactor guanylyltransferase n=1 Tax=Terriglobus sp. TaxID=1889013 RepID=UPI003AFFD355